MEILQAGQPILKEQAKAVEQIDKRVVRILEAMKSTMDEYGIHGLSAPQIGEPYRIVTIDMGDGVLYEMINPVITNKRNEKLCNEGCISVPQFNGTVVRATFIECEFYDRKGEWLHLAAEGALAVAIQHEVDHLDGIMFLDKAVSIVPVRQVAMNRSKPYISNIGVNRLV